MHREQAARRAHCWVICLGRVDRRSTVYTARLKRTLAYSTGLFPPDGNSNRRARAILTISAMLGAINLSHAVSDPNQPAPDFWASSESTRICRQLPEDLSNAGFLQSGSNKGHDVVSLQYLCVFMGCHLRRKVVRFAASHEAVNRRVVGSSPT